MLVIIVHNQAHNGCFHDPSRDDIFSIYFTTHDINIRGRKLIVEMGLMCKLSLLSILFRTKALILDLRGYGSEIVVNKCSFHRNGGR